MRYQRTLSIVLVAIMLITTAVPSMTVHAQEIPDENCEGSGVFYWPCRVIESLASGVRNFFNWILNTITGFFTFLGQVFEWVTTAIGNVISFVGDIIRLILSFIEMIFNLINEVIQIVILIIQIIVALVKALGAWLFQMVGIVVAIVLTFFSTAPVAFPGVPQCITAPTAHDICSVYYLADNTVFGGSVGGLIVTVILIIIDVVIVFLFARTILKYLRLGEGVTDVG
jgi:hypothetical protein